MTKTAYLRVYTPEASRVADPVPGFVRTYGLLSEGEGDADWAAEWNGIHMVCPRSLRLRVLESTVAFANAFQGLGAGLIPERAAEAAEDELRVYRREHPGQRSHVLTSAWHVPVRWFTPFRSDDREVYEVDGGPRLRFRVAIETAKSRLRATHQVLARLRMLQGPGEEMAQLLEWVGGFPEPAMLELDYAEVSTLFDPQELVFDDSVELLHRSVEALSDGDMVAAGECYGRVVTRWAPAFSVTFSN